MAVGKVDPKTLIDQNRQLPVVRIKAKDDKRVIVEGWGVIFDTVDLYEEKFTAETDFQLELVPIKNVYYDHTMSGVKHEIGKASNKNITVKDDESIAGLWIEAQLERSQAYVEEIIELIEKGILGWSSGSIGHLIEMNGKTIKRWPIVEFSLTPTPAEPRTLGVDIIKTLAEENPKLQALLPQDAGASSAGDNGGEADSKAIRIEITNKENNNMSKEKLEDARVEPVPASEVVPAPEPVAPPVDNGQETAVKALQTQMDDFSTRMNEIMKLIEDAPALKNAGYVTQDGGKADPNIKNLGDFFKAVHRGDEVRLREVYGAHKAMGEDTGTTGGYVVPEEFEATLMQVAAENAVVRPFATVVPVGSNRGKIPSLDQFAAPTAGVGDTALAADVTVTSTAENATLTEKTPSLEQIEYNIRKIGGYTQVPNELMADSAISVEALLRNLFGVAIANKEDFYFLRGTGANEPLGILNWDGLVDRAPATNDTFAYVDALAMLSLFLPVGPKRESIYWLAHRSTIPDIGAFEVSTGSGAAYMANLNIGPTAPLLGYPIAYSEHLPQANSPYHVNLCDLSAYVIFDRQNLEISFSEHVGFLTDQGTWRFTKRLDGQPWMRDSITLADPQGSYKVGPFVGFNDPV